MNNNQNINENANEIINSTMNRHRINSIAKTAKEKKDNEIINIDNNNNTISTENKNVNKTPIINFNINKTDPVTKQQFQIEALFYLL